MNKKRQEQFDLADTCVVSYPKSGRTWLRVLLGKYLCDLHGLNPEYLFHKHHLTDLSGLPPICYTHDGSSHKEGLHVNELSSDKSSFKDKRVIFLHRDPRDVVISCYFQATRRRRSYQGTISKFIRDETLGIKKIMMFNAIWLANRNAPKAFISIEYEDLHARPKGILTEVLRFIGLETIDDELIDGAIAYARFENMQELEAQETFKSKKLRPGNQNDPESFKVRRGKVGGYSDYLDEEDIAFLDSVISNAADRQ